MTGGEFREMHLYVHRKAYGITASAYPGEGDLDFGLSRLGHRIPRACLALDNRRSA